MKYELVPCPACGGKWSDFGNCKQCCGTGKVQPAVAAEVAARIEGYKAPTVAPTGENVP